MIEILTPPIQAGTTNNSIEKEPLRQSEAIYRAKLDDLSTMIPEIEQSKDILATSGKEIIKLFEIQPELFDDLGRSLVFTAVAKRWVSNKNPVTPKGKAEQTFLSDTIGLLAYEYSPNLNEAKSQIEKEANLPDEGRLIQIYERFTDKQLTTELEKAIKDGLLNEVKSQMGVNSQNEDPYEVKVLSITTGNSLETAGLTSSEYPKDLDFITPEGQQAARQADIEWQTEHNAVKAWEQGLLEKGDQFAQSLNRDKNFAPAFVTRFGGKTLLCISAPFAEKILYPDITKNSTYYDEDYRKRDMAILEHEYAHTQGGLNIDNDVLIGIGLEELRAEHFSGNKQGYQEVKGFFMDYAVVTGQKVQDLIDNQEKGGQKAEIYGKLAEEVGLELMLETILVSPNNYLTEQSNPFSREIQNYLGGYDGVIGRIMDQQVYAGKQADIDSRIVKWADIIAKGIDLDVWVSMRKKSGLNVVTDLVAEKAKRIKASDNSTTPDS